MSYLALLQSLSIAAFGRMTSGRLSSHPIYRRNTNNTAQKLAELLATPLK